METATHGRRKKSRLKISWKEAEGFATHQLCRTKLQKGRFLMKTLCCLKNYSLQFIKIGNFCFNLKNWIKTFTYIIYSRGPFFPKIGLYCFWF